MLPESAVKDGTIGSTRSAIRELQRSMIQLLIKLGEGQFGQAWLCSDKTSTTPKPYVLKIISKYHLVSEGFVETTVREKRIMADLNHPLIIDLISVYQDDAFLYMLLDFVPGGELFSLMNPAPDEKVKINESQAKIK